MWIRYSRTMIQAAVPHTTPLSLPESTVRPHGCFNTRMGMLSRIYRGFQSARCASPTGNNGFAKVVTWQLSMSFASCQAASLLRQGD